MPTPPPVPLPSRRRSGRARGPQPGARSSRDHLGDRPRLPGRECQAPQDCQTHQHCRSASNGTPRPAALPERRPHQQRVHLIREGHPKKENQRAHQRRTWTSPARLTTWASASAGIKITSPHNDPIPTDLVVDSLCHPLSEQAGGRCSPQPCLRSLTYLVAFPNVHLAFTGRTASRTLACEHTAA